jgi:hypothetical protein
MTCGPNKERQSVVGTMEYVFPKPFSIIVHRHGGETMRYPLLRRLMLNESQDRDMAGFIFQDYPS